MTDWIKHGGGHTPRRRERGNKVLIRILLEFIIPRILKNTVLEYSEKLFPKVNPPTVLPYRSQLNKEM